MFEKILYFVVSYTLQMKRITFMIIAASISFAGCKSTKPVAGQQTPASPAIEAAPVQHTVNYSDQATWLLGYFNPLQLKGEPHSAWFYKGYDEYMPDRNAMDNLKSIATGDLSIKIVMGTWCPDSRREVPRFEKILDEWKMPAEKVTFIGVDNAKISPIGEYDKLEIHRVPTFIIYRNNIEAGRIIENPVTSLEQDMVNILRGMNNNK
jgi:thiol-disulfide isomerase/thioredoxin